MDRIFTVPDDPELKKGIKALIAAALKKYAAAENPTVRDLVNGVNLEKSEFISYGFGFTFSVGIPLKSGGVWRI